MPGAPPAGHTTLLNARSVEWRGISAAALHITDGYLAAEASPVAWTRNMSDHLIFPGLINAHDHLQLNCFPPLPDREPFPNSYVWIDAFQPYHADPAVRAARAVPSEKRHWHGALKNLLCGVTTVAHHDPWHSIFDSRGFPVQTLSEYGWSHSLRLGAAAPDHAELRYGPQVRASFDATPVTQPWIIHLAEGTDAVAASELKSLEKMGCLASNTLLVHGVGLTPSDQERVVSRGAGVIWCPTSNLALLGRTLRPRRLLEAGRLALGTDSRLAGSFDLLEELRAAAIHGPCSPPELLALVTAAGSRLLQMPTAGGLSPGCRADMLIVRDRGNDPYQQLIDLARADIGAVVRGGHPAIADPDFADWFAASGIEAQPVRLDGRPKLCAKSLLGPPGTAALESGLEILK